MAADAVFELRTDKLDTKLLATPFEVITSWHVIAGAPSCGKTTLIEMLAARGFRTVAEPAREYTEGEIARGRTIKDIHADGTALERTIVELQLAAEADLRPDQLLFVDGSVPSSLAWYRAFGMDPNEILPKCFGHRCAAVFLLDPLPLKVDRIRFNDAELVSFLDTWIAADCRALGYDLVRVPVLPPDGRLTFVLDHLAVDRLR